MVNFNNPRAIILYYPAYAGGKFLSNVLALSKDCVGMIKWATAADIQSDGYDYATFYKFMAGADWPPFNEFIDQSYQVNDRIKQELDQFPEAELIRFFYTLYNNCAYYDFKLKSVLTTLPTKDELLDWRKFEPDHNTFSGVSDSDYLTIPLDDLKFNDITEFVSNSNRRFTMIAHDYPLLQKYQARWPNATIIELVNYRKFQLMSHQLKGPYNTAPIAKPADIGREIIHFDVDSAYYDKNAFLDAVKELYQQLGLTDFNKDLVEPFYLAYAQLHGLV